jgi:hypothetical protein
VGDIDKYLAELGWREFCRHLLFDAPDLATRSLQPSFDAFPWRHGEKSLRAWQRGQTGYPIVDPGMRELWRTGVMHNRVRMVAASFLVKHLLIDWREGEKWFWDTLVDADPASDPANWQWVARSGADAAPYFRVFNPILQGEKFDPDGARMSGAGCPNWRDCRPAPSTSRGAQRRLSSPVPASNSARHIPALSLITGRAANARSRLMRRSEGVESTASL